MLSKSCFKLSLLFLFVLASTINAQSEFTNEIQTASQVDKDTTSFKKGQIYAGLGLPYVINVGLKVRLNKKNFLEFETGYYASFGITTINYVKKPSFIYFDGEAEILVGYFLPPFLAPQDVSGFGSGIAVRGNLETNFDLSIYMKLGVAYLFNEHFIPISQWGLSYNF